MADLHSPPSIRDNSYNKIATDLTNKEIRIKSITVIDNAVHLTTQDNWNITINRNDLVTYLGMQHMPNHSMFNDTRLKRAINKKLTLDIIKPIDYSRGIITVYIKERMSINDQTSCTLYAGSEVSISRTIITLRGLKFPVMIDSNNQEFILQEHEVEIRINLESLNE